MRPLGVSSRRFEPDRRASELEVETPSGSLDPAWGDRFRDDDQPIVDVPPNDNLRRRAAVLGRHRADDRIGQEMALASGLQDSVLMPSSS